MQGRNVVFKSKASAGRAVSVRRLCGLAAIVILASGGASLGASSQAATPQVVFMAPKDGATVSSPVTFEFGVKYFMISPVPEEVDEVRAGVGHYHLGFDTECLPVGAEIPKADPWVHFGDGSATFETLLEPGEHTFALQMGDDEHRTLEGLCETMTIHVR